MATGFRVLLFSLGLGLAFAATASAADPEPAADQAGPPPPQFVLLRVQVDAAGKVQSSRALDPNAVPALVNAAQELAGKLQFAPAQKSGRTVSSETSLVLTLALEPRAGGGFGIALKRKGEESDKE